MYFWYIALSSHKFLTSNQVKKLCFNIYSSNQLIENLTLSDTTSQSYIRPVILHDILNSWGYNRIVVSGQEISLVNDSTYLTDTRGYYNPPL